MTHTAHSTAEIFDLTDAQVRDRASLKWSTMDPDVLPAWVAEMDVTLAPAITATLQQALSRHDAGYPGSGAGLSQAFTDFARERWDWHIASDQVSIHVDVATAAGKLLQHYAGTDGRVIIMPPVYNQFFAWLVRNDLQAFEVPLKDMPGGGHLDLGGVEAGLKAGVKAILLCNPHNPLGRVFSAEELGALAELADRYGAVVISDEIHAPLVFHGVEFSPWLTVSDASRRTGIALHAATKSWNFAGLKCGIVVRSTTGPWPSRLDPASTITDAGFWGVLATEAAFRDARDWLDTVREHFAAQTQLLTELVAAHLPGVSFHAPQASFLAWLNFRETALTQEPAEYFLAMARVALSPGINFGDAGRGYARLNMGTSAERLERIIAAMGTAWPPR